MASTTGLAIVFACTILSLVAVSMAGVSLPRNTPALFGAGAMSGLMGTTIGVGGPPLTLVYQRSSGSEIRGTLAPIQSFGAVTSIVRWLWSGSSDCPTWAGACCWPRAW